MSSTHWFLLIGFLLLARGLTATPLRFLPVTSAIMYLGVGLLLGPTGLNLFYFDPFSQSALLELLTEVAVLISLFSAGVKMPVPVTLARWNAPLRLAFIAMTLSVLLVAAFAVFALGLSWGAAVLLGAVLAPTDPVLATDVQSRHAGDNDQLLFTLTSEAGMNDGSAFPFVMLGLGLLGLHDLGTSGLQWLLIDVLWATVIAVLIGIVSGVTMAQISWRLRGMQVEHEILDDLVGLGMIALVYGLTVSAQAYGFLAVFFSGVALRQTELSLAKRAGVKPSVMDADTVTPIREIQGKAVDLPPTVSGESLIFKEHLERLSELLLVLLLGGMMFPQFWTIRTLSLAAFVLLIARPASTMLSLLGTSTRWNNRLMEAWFGVRGIGSVYYLMYAIQHGVPAPLSRDLIQLTLVVITASIVLHGTSVKPILHRYWRPAR